MSPRWARSSAGRPALLRLAAAFALGIAAALLVSCGSSGKGLIPSANAGPLQSDFEAVAQAAQSGNGSCAATEAAIAKTERTSPRCPRASTWACATHCARASQTSARARLSCVPSRSPPRPRRARRRGPRPPRRRRRRQPRAPRRRQRRRHPRRRPHDPHDLRPGRRYAGARGTPRAERARAPVEGRAARCGTRRRGGAGGQEGGK